METRGKGEMREGKGERKGRGGRKKGGKKPALPIKNLSLAPAEGKDQRHS